MELSLDGLALGLGKISNDTADYSQLTNAKKLYGQFIFQYKSHLLLKILAVPSLPDTSKTVELLWPFPTYLRLHRCLSPESESICHFCWTFFMKVGAAHHTEPKLALVDTA